MGDHVKVIAGRYEGDTGLVVKMEVSQAVVFSDLTMSEVSLNASICTRVFHIHDKCYEMGLVYKVY